MTKKFLINYVCPFAIIAVIAATFVLGILYCDANDTMTYGPEAKVTVAEFMQQFFRK